MIHNRKNTTEVVGTWRDFLGNKNATSNTRLNESMMDSEEDYADSSMSSKDRNEHFEALIADLADCDWSSERIDMLVRALKRCNLTDSELKIIGYPDEPMSDEAKNWQQDRFIEREPLEVDEDLGM